MVARLQIKASQIGKILQTLENKSNEANMAADSGSDSRKNSTSRPLGHYKNKSGDFGPPVKKPHYIDPIPPFNANKIRKSPSGNPTESTPPIPPSTPDIKEETSNDDQIE